MPDGGSVETIWMLLKMEFDRGAIKAGLQRMRRASHGAPTTEQAHAPGAVVMKMRRTYGDETMRGRAFIFQTKPLLHADPHGEETHIAQRPLREG
mgnify:CR=1 FL=1